MRTINLAVRDEQGQLLEKVDVRIDEAATDYLERFLATVDRVRDTSLLERGMPGVTNISWKNTEGWVVTCAEYSNAELHELLHVLRPLILRREPYSFQNASAFLSRLVANDKFNRWLRLQRQIYEKGELGLYMQFSVGDQKIFDESFLSLWLNAEQYHNDSEKRAAWIDLEASLTSENIRGLLMGQLQGRVKAIFNLAYIAGLLVGDKRDVA